MLIAGMMKLTAANPYLDFTLVLEILGAVGHHSAPGGLLLAVLIVLAILYVGWRTGRLGRAWSAARARRLSGRGGGLAGVRVRPLALLPTLLLILVVVLLLITRQ
jgi:hypothetical protein